MKIGYAYVCGDILHYGHIRYLENAKALCGKLIVGVLSDKAIMVKKPKPTIPLIERLEMVQALKCIDAVVVQDDYWPTDNIAAIQPDMVIESSSHKEPYFFPGMRTVIFPYFPEQSSTKIKKKIKNG